MQRWLRTSYAAAFSTEPVWVDYQLLSGAVVKVLIALCGTSSSLITVTLHAFAISTLSVMVRPFPSSVK